MGGGAPTPRQTVCAGTKACVWAETGVKMQSWLKRRQLEQRPSSVASKPEQRIWQEVSKTQRARVGWSSYLAASAVATGNGSALAGRGRLVVLLDVLGRGRRALLAVRVLRRRGARPLVGAGQTVLLLVLRVLVGGHVRARLLRRRRRQCGVHLSRAVSAGGRAAGSLWASDAGNDAGHGRCTAVLTCEGGGG